MNKKSVAREREKRERKAQRRREREERERKANRRVRRREQLDRDRQRYITDAGEIDKWTWEDGTLTNRIVIDFDLDRLPGVGEVQGLEGYGGPKDHWQVMKSLIEAEVRRAMEQFGSSVMVQLRYDAWMENAQENNRVAAWGIWGVKHDQDRFQVNPGTTSADFSRTYDRQMNKMADQLSIIEGRGSGWSYHSSRRMLVKIWRLVPQTGTGGRDVPIWVQNKKGKINVQNEDDMCFVWSILSCLLADQVPEKNRNKVENYEKLVEFRDGRVYQTKYYQNRNLTKTIRDLEGIEITLLDLRGITFPFSFDQIDRFLELNPHLSIQIMATNEMREPHILYQMPDGKERCTHVDLWLYQGPNRDGTKDISHFMWIHKFDTFFGRNNTRKTCDRCLAGFVSEEKLLEHKKKCGEREEIPVKADMPKMIKTENGEVPPRAQFTDWKKCLPSPYVIVMDFEAIPKEKHLPCSFFLYAIPWDQRYKKINEGRPVICRGGRTEEERLICDGRVQLIKVGDPQWTDEENARRVMKEFFRQLTKLKSEIAERVLKHQYPISMTAEDEQRFLSSEKCHFCRKPLGEDRVRDHDHLLPGNNFRGAAHSNCNLQANLKNWKIPVFSHNLIGYDSHFIFEYLGEWIKDQEKPNIKVVSKGGGVDTFMTFIIRGTAFRDSYQLNPTSLDSWIRTLDHRPEMERILGNDELVLQKGVYPYEYFDSFSKFDETEHPTREEFHSTIKGGITEKDYGRSLDIRKKFGLHTMGEYHDLYLLADGLGLADCLMAKRRFCMKTDGLDPANYISASQLSYGKLMKSVWDRPELLTEEEMYTFFEKAKRGGINGGGRYRHVKANHKYMGEEYDPNKESVWLVPVDCNALYPTAAKMKMPHSDFRWESPEAAPLFLNKELYRTHCKPNGWGAELEVDIEFPKEVHDYLADYPLCPNHEEVEMSPYMEKIKEEVKKNMAVPRSSKSKKLVCTLKPKSNYVVHHKLLRLYIRLGAVVTKVHRMVTFKEKAWVKPYMEKTLHNRREAKTKAEQDNYKLDANSVAGKFLQDTRKYTNIYFDSYAKQMHLIDRRRANPLFIDDEAIADGNINVTVMKKAKAKLNSIIATGTAILDLSKYWMFKFYYDVLKKKYGDRITLIYTDTDSFFLMIKTEDWYQDLREDDELRYWIDLSEYPEDLPDDHPAKDLIDRSKYKREGFFKCLSKGRYLVEMIQLSSKMYSTLYRDHSGILEEENKVKGISRTYTKEELKMENYRRCLYGEFQQKATFGGMERTGHEIRTVQRTKVSLSFFDDKRYYLSENESLPHGHYAC